MYPIIVLCVFGLVAIVHLVFCFFSADKWRRVTKPLLMPLLAMLHLLSMQQPNPLILAALFFAFLGDVFLLRTDPPFVLPGLGSFLVCQVLYAISIALSVPGVFSPTHLLILVPYAAYSVMLYRKLSASLKKMKLPAMAYLAALMAMSALALRGAVIAPSAAAWLIFAGSLFFVASDTLLAFEIFRSPYKRSNFYIMLTYLLAQLCIVVGFTLFSI